MKKTLSMLLIISMLFSMCCFGTLAAETETAYGSGKYDKSKTATELYDDRYTDVTLSIPGEVETLSTDIVFVIDKSSSDKLSSNFANDFFEQLIEVQKASGASIKVGVVIYNYDGHVALPLTALTAQNYQTLLNSLPSYKGGTNADAGLILAKQMLDADTGVDASRKHVILIGDGLNWAFDVNGKPHTILVKKSESSQATQWGAGTQPWISGRGVSTSYEIPGGMSWDEYWAKIKEWVEADGDKYVFDITNYSGEDTSIPTPDYNSAQAVASAVVEGEAGSHALNMDRALYDTWESYTALQNAGYNCNAYYTSQNSVSVGYHLMKMLAGTSSMDFESIKNDILYSVSKGSVVVDYIGYSDDPEEGYDFDFVDKIGDELKLPVIKVGDKVYVTKKLDTPFGDATATYEFSASEDADPTFAMDYYRGNGTTEEHFIWTINEDVSRFAPVSLTYTLDLVERSELPGEHVADTNQHATLYPVDSTGKEGEPERFPVPEVDYEVIRKDYFAVIKGKKVFDRELKSGMFEFALKEDGEVIATAHNDEKGNFSFGIKLEEPGVYEYTVEEIDNGDDDIVFDHSVYNVTVTANKDGTTKVEYDRDIVFENATFGTARATINGYKYLDGELADGFTFVLEDDMGNIVTTTSEGGEFEFDLELDEAYTHVYYVYELDENEDGIVYDDTVFEVRIDVERAETAYTATVRLMGVSEIAFYNETIPEETTEAPEETTEVPEETTEAPEETTEIPEETTEAPEETTEVPEETTEAPEVTTEPEEEITEEPTPLDPAPETTEPEEEITDPEIPLDPNPKTGDSVIILVIAAIAVLALAALYIKRRQVTED